MTTSVLGDDPRQALATRPMSVVQIIVIAVTMGLNALDGFDVLAISFASPGIASEWGIDRAALGIVLSMELIGMGLGSFALGGFSDKFGRRRTLLGCLFLMTVGMVMATQSGSIQVLSIWRVFTGIGIGGMLATINAVAAEFSNRRRRSLSVSLMAIGYPLGAVAGGTIAALLLHHSTWRSVFWFGAAATAVQIPLVLWLVPESIPWLCERQPPGALPRLNASLRKLGYGPLTSLPAASIIAHRRSILDIFSAGLVRDTVLVSLAYLLHVTSYYFIVKWVPKIVVDMGFTASSAASILVWTNVGGATGGAALGLLSLRFGLRHLTIAALAMSTVMLAIFGRGNIGFTPLAVICGIVGFFTNAGIVGLYGILAQAFPADLRSTGTGFVVGAGRAGAVLAPIVAGFLFRAGFSLQFVSIAMGTGSLAGALALFYMRLRRDDTPTVPLPTEHERI